jgi:stress-induced morphogen
MMEPARIQALLEQGLPDCTALVTDNAGDKQHFQAEVVSSAFEGVSLVKQHRMVYQALGQHMRSDIHALALKTYTPSKWAARQG